MNEEKKMPYKATIEVLVWPNKDKEGNPYLTIDIPSIGLKIPCWKQKPKTEEKKEPKEEIF